MVGDTQSNLTNVDPLLGALANNRGPTATQNLLTGSPALDTGAPQNADTPCEVTDQRGVVRPADFGVGVVVCDIGAYEKSPCGNGIQDHAEGCDLGALNGAIGSCCGLLPLGVLFVALGVPLAMNRIPPNRLYGFRSGATSSSSAVWYGVNRATGIDLVLVGVVLIGREFVLPEVGVPRLVLLVSLVVVVLAHGMRVSRTASDRARGATDDVSPLA